MDEASFLPGRNFRAPMLWLALVTVFHQGCTNERLAVSRGCSPSSQSEECREPARSPTPVPTHGEGSSEVTTPMPSSPDSPFLPQGNNSAWSAVGTGISYRLADPEAPHVFVGYGGWSVQASWARTWVDALFRARLRSLGIGRLYAVQGPAHPQYLDREIENSALARRLAATCIQEGCRVYVAAHSSGSFVAHELLRQLAGSAEGAAVLGRTRYFNLDGGASGFDASLAQRLAGVVFVAASDVNRGMRSRNFSTMKSLAELHGKPFVSLGAEGSGCRSEWCLHDALITRQPHNPDDLDLERDYTRFSEERAVTHEYVSE